MPSEWLQNSSFEPEATKLINNVTENNINKNHEKDVINSYKLYKKFHGKKEKKKEKKRIKKIKRPK